MDPNYHDPYNTETELELELDSSLDTDTAAIAEMFAASSAEEPLSGFETVEDGEGSDYVVESDFSSSEDESGGEEEAAEPRPGPSTAQPAAKRARTQATTTGTPVAPSPFKWTHADNFVRRHPFTGQPGVQHPDLNSDSTPKEILDCFIDEEMYERIARETNRFAASKLEEDEDPEGEEPAPRRHQRSWVTTCVEEIRVVFCLLVLMGIVHKPGVKLYWSQDPLIVTPIFGDTMPRDRVLAILNYLHFRDSEEEEEDDRLTKIRPIITTLLLNCQNVFVPYQEISIDESLLKYKGRLGWSVFCPSKRARFGIKAYKLCASSGRTCGYTWNFGIYTGEDKKKAKNKGVSAKVVEDLMAGLLKQGYNLYLDNWYSSPGLYTSLHKNQTNVCGTVRLERANMPTDWPKSRTGKVVVPKGEEEHRTNGKGLLAMIWMDKKVVKMLSTMHRANMVNTGKVDRKTKRPIIKPKCVVDYNAGMGGVDRSDQMAVAGNAAARKFVKWYKKLFLHLFDMSMVNAFCVYKELRPDSTMDYLGFKLAYVRETLSECLQHCPVLPVKGGRPPAAAPPKRLVERHFNMPHPPTEKKANPCKPCVVCRAHNKRRESRYGCPECQVSLCTGQCFKDYHTLVNY